MSGRQEQGPRSDRRRPKGSARCLPASLIFLALLTTDTVAQTLTTDLLRPERDGFSGQNRPLRRVGDPNNADGSAPATGTNGEPAPSRIGRTPKFEIPAASGASSTGFDSLNRKKKNARRKAGVSATVAPKEIGIAPPVQILPVIVPVVPPPPPLPSAATANKARLAPSMAGSVPGQPQRRRLKVDDDPFGAVGFYRGSMLVKPAIELYTGYDTNPGRIKDGKGSWLYMVAPELLVASDWERHSLIADLRGSFTGYSLKNETDGAGTVSSLPVIIDRPDINGKVTGRYDVSRDTRIISESRVRVGTDNPGSPNIQANLQRYPLFTSFGTTLGGAHAYNRFEIAANGTVDRTVYQESTLSDGTRSSNNDRNYNQFGGSLRGSYEILPQIKPFGEVAIDRRERDLEFDRNGFARNSNGRTARIGSTFELGRLITGEAAIGYSTRSYEDPRLHNASGLLASGSLIWKPTGLTTVTVAAQSSIDESTLPGVSGVITRNYNAQVEHAFRRYLIATLKAGYTTSDYDGSDRFDKVYSVGGDLVYKFTRDVQLKAQLRHDWLKSTIASADYQATLFMLGVRLQR